MIYPAQEEYTFIKSFNNSSMKDTHNYANANYHKFILGVPMFLYILYYIVCIIVSGVDNHE